MKGFKRNMMAKIDIVADAQTRKKDLKELPLFDSTNVVNWSNKLKMWLMRKKCNHLFLREKIPQASNQRSCSRARVVSKSTGNLVVSPGCLHQCNLRISVERT